MRIALMAGMFWGLLSSAVHAVPTGSPEGAEAFALCQQAAQLPDQAQIEALERALAIAEAAVARGANDGVAQFATFCALGRLVLLEGVSPFRPLRPLRVLHALDAAVRLAPDDPDVLTAKGAVLLSLPRVMGGDTDAGIGWLRAALARDPHHCAARAYLQAAEALHHTSETALRVLAVCVPAGQRAEVSSQ